MEKSRSLIFFLYPNVDPDHSQNLMGSKLDREPSAHFLHEDLASSICLILLTSRQTVTNLIHTPPWWR